MMLAFRELVEDYDADGLLLDFIRYPSLFDPDRDMQNQELLTQYVGQVRNMLDAAARKKGRRLPLAVQVLAHPNECIRYGQDVSSWMRKGYVDYVLLSQSNNIDCNLPVDLWVKLAKGTQCDIYPTLHPFFHFLWNVENRATLEDLRGVAHLYYSQGATGLSTMNMFNPLQHRWFTELRDPGKLACGARRYRYVPAGTMRTDNMSWRATTPLRIFDPPDALTGGVLAVLLENAKDDGELEFTLNGKTIPRTGRAGKTEYLRYPTNQKGMARFEFPVAGLSFVPGINYLGVQLRSVRPYDQAWVTVREVELSASGSTNCRTTP
jgi:hypothetical protein